MSSTADKYISESGRTAKYDRAALVDDMVTAGAFLVWAEREGAMYGGMQAGDALRAMCRMLDVDPRGLRKAIMAEDEPKDPCPKGYSPDLMAMGDCLYCGRLKEDHE